MSKYAVGNYLIIGFDRVGTKLFTRIAESQTHIGSLREGQRLVDEEECSSFVTLRVGFNSLTKENSRWEK